VVGQHQGDAASAGWLTTTGGPIINSSFWRLAGAIALGGAGAIVLWSLLVRLYPTIAIFAAGFLIAYLLDPALDKLEKRGWSRVKAVWAVALPVALAVTVAGVGVLPVLVGQLQTAASHWPQYVDGAQVLYDRGWKGFSDILQLYSPDVTVMPYLGAKVDSIGDWAVEKVPQLLLWVSDQLARSLSVLGVVLLVAVVALHFMMVIDPLRRQVASVLSPGEVAEVAEVDQKINLMLGQYLRGMALTSLAVAIATGVVLQVIGVFLGSEYGLLIGALAGIGYAIPWLGAAVTCVTAGFLGYVTADHHAVIAAVAGLATVLVVNQASDTLIMPSIVGRRIGLHPLAVIFALLAGYALLGIWGMILATPLAAALKIVLCRWLPICEEPAEAPPRRKHLTLDISALLRQIAGAVQPLARRIEEKIAEGSKQEAEPEEEGNDVSGH